MCVCICVHMHVCVYAYVCYCPCRPQGEQYTVNSVWWVFVCVVYMYLNNR